MIQIGQLPNILVVNPALPVKDVRELIAYAKANPAKLSYASSGNGASSHLAGVLFNGIAGTDLQHVPYKGTGPALNDLLGGQVSMSFTDVLTALPYIKAGKLRPLGIATRAALARPCPTCRPWPSRACKGYDVSVFFGIVAPAGTPPETIAKLEQGLRRGARDAQGQAAVRIARAGAGGRRLAAAARPLHRRRDRQVERRGEASPAPSSIDDAMTTSPTAHRPARLAGIRVLDISRILGGPYCGQILGDHGADVLKVEPPQGDDTRDLGPALQGRRGLVLPRPQPQQARRWRSTSAAPRAARRCWRWWPRPTC